jgi:hypothetical protein
MKLVLGTSSGARNQNDSFDEHPLLTQYLSGVLQYQAFLSLCYIKMILQVFSNPAVIHGWIPFQKIEKLFSTGQVLRDFIITACI